MAKWSVTLALLATNAQLQVQSQLHAHRLKVLIVVQLVWILVPSGQKVIAQLHNSTRQPTDIVAISAQQVTLAQPPQQPPVLPVLTHCLVW